jgi:hypothetical protein
VLGDVTPRAGAPSPAAGIDPGSWHVAGGITSTHMVVNVADAVRALSRPRHGNTISELGSGILLRASELKDRAGQRGSQFK